MSLSTWEKRVKYSLRRLSFSRMHLGEEKEEEEEGGKGKGNHVRETNGFVRSGLLGLMMRMRMRGCEVLVRR